MRALHMTCCSSKMPPRHLQTRLSQPRCF